MYIKVFTYSISIRLYVDRVQYAISTPTYSLLHVCSVH